MSTSEFTDYGSVRAQALNEEYEKLGKFHVDRRRIVLLDDNQKREGGFGIVRRAELYQSAYLPARLGSRLYGPPQLVAVKQIRVSDFATMTRAKRAFTREMLVWSSLEAHPGIAKFLGFYADFEHSKAWLLSPWEPNGNVSEFVKAHNLEVPEKLSLVYDTIDALDFLHHLNPPVCHGDIKSANVLVGADYKARLCDFGLALLYEDSGFKRLETSTGAKGSVRWNSPEIIEGAPRAPTSDVYAWAWLVWEIMTGDLPYGAASNDYAIILKIFESPLPQVDGASRLSDCLQLWDLMMRCWTVDPRQRPSARICKTTVAHLPHCTPTPINIDHQNRSAALLENLGDLETWKGNSERSTAYLNEALRCYQEESDTKGIASVLRKQATAAYRYSDYGKAITTATAALADFRNLNDPLGIADASFWLGASLLMQGQTDEALPVLEESLQIYRMHGDDAGAGLCLERIGELQRRTYQTDEALSTLEEAVAVASRSGDRFGLTRALVTLGVVHFDRGDLDRAAEAFSRARPVAQHIGSYASLSDIGRLMGEVKMELGDYHEAEALLQDSISIARQSGARWSLACALELLGGCLQKESKSDEAASALGEACLLFQELSYLQDSMKIASTLVEIKSGQGDWDGALSWHDHIITAYRSHKDHAKVADHLELKSRTLVKARRYDEAALHLEATIIIRGELNELWSSKWRRLRRQLCAIAKTTMKWERRLPLLCDVKRLQRREPQLRTAILGLPIPFNRGEI